MRFFLGILALLLLCASVRAYIDMPAEKLTLPRLMLEFRTIGVYRIERFDAERGAVRYRLVETIQGNPREAEKHTIFGGSGVPKDFKGLKEGDLAVLFGPDPYKRSLTYLAGAWYVSTWDRRSGWWRFAYDSSHFDFNCAFLGTLPQLVDACRALLDGDEAVVPCRQKPRSPDVQFVRCTLRDPHRRTPVASMPAARPVLPARGPADIASDDPRGRMLAVREIGRRGAASEQDISLLTRMLNRDKDPFVRRDCAIALGRIGRAAAPAVPALFAVFRDGYECIENLVSCEAAVAILRIDPDGEVWLPFLRSRLADANTVIRRKAVEAIGILGPPALATTPLLLEAMKDPSAEVRYNAARGLQRIEADARLAAPALVAALSDKDKYVPDAAIQGLRNLGPDAAEELVRALRPANAPQARRCAALLLYELGPAARSVAPALAGFTNDPDGEVRNLVRKALQKLPPAGHD